MPGPAPSVYSPFSRCGMPQANSTTSRPRWMSPRASGKVLPCSEDSSLARSSYSFCTSSRNLNITRARRCGLVAAQAGCAASALAMACSTSECLASATLACTSPVLGSKTSPNRPEVPLTALPPMKWPISRMGRSPPMGRSVRDCGPFVPVLSIFAGYLRAVTGLAGHGQTVTRHRRLAFTAPCQRQSRVVSRNNFAAVAFIP